MEDGGRPAERKCSFLNYRRTIFFLFFFSFFVILYSLNVIETSNSWTEKIWSHYVNATSQIKLPNSTLKKLFFDWSAKRTTTVMATSTAPPLPPPDYKSPGAFYVEYPYKYKFIINEPTGCEKLKPFLVLIVPVAPQNIEDRRIIRETWGAQKTVSDKNIAVFFLLGLGNADENELLKESKQYQDVIQSDFMDCYKNLTIKTMVMMEWLDAYCPQASYAMKIDSDIFLNLPKLMEMLQSAQKTNYLSGLVERAAIVQRSTTSKWYIPREVYDGDTFPPYTLGLAYVFSRDLPKKLVEAAREVKALCIEDVFLGMCMRHLGLSPTDPTVHGAFHVFPFAYNRCQYSRIVATVLDVHTDRRQLWKDFSKPEPYC
ncbi:hypothetical protein NL108_012119 [Boleophthalmus pectinirostris]|uniref:beta-1,3-galactosyltransferase 5-like n=1 Tax=Boleophthalmus pectinirostris TaxID=150288 RepID=UPI000A1C5566|nr:beta-1,3-galactosyltransferase 5-like [Boleophthalmus pectinirostris]KAJ0056684.1 hypothetical protein NL108_012119 [Boleophthalmus pectinirostris]